MYTNGVYSYNYLTISILWEWQLIEQNVCTENRTVGQRNRQTWPLTWQNDIKEKEDIKESQRRWKEDWHTSYN